MLWDTSKQSSMERNYKKKDMNNKLDLRILSKSHFKEFA